MGTAFALVAAAISAGCGWPASALISRLGVPVPEGELPAEAAGPAAAGAGPQPPVTGPATGLAPDSAAAAVTIRLRCVLTALTAVLAFAVSLRLHPAPVAVAGCWLVVCGVPLATIDARVRRLPDVLTLPLLAGLAAALAAAAIGAGSWAGLARAGAGAVVVAGLFTVLALVRPGSAGLGDAKLGLSTGALAGWLGWGVLLAAVFAAFLLAACCGLVLIAARRAALRTGSLPFGPFLLAGCLAAVILSSR